MKREPRAYQREQLDAIRAAFFQKKLTRVLVKSPTGTGKTVTFAMLLVWFNDWLKNHKNPKMLVIAHREELLDQAAEKIADANPDKVVMVEQGERVASPYCDVVVASVQTLSAMGCRRLLRLKARMDFRIVVVDEAHHSAADTYRLVLAHLGFLPLDEVEDEDGKKKIIAKTWSDAKKMAADLEAWDKELPADRLLIGVTATPNRSDAIGLSCVYQDIVYSYELRQAIKDGWLVKLTPYAVETKASLDAVKTTAGDFNQKQLADTVNTPERNRLALAAWEEKGEGRTTLGFTVDVAHAHDVAEEFQRAGHRFMPVSGETPKEDRRILMRQCSEGQLDGLVNCMILTEGTDLPRVSCILNLKPTKSATLYEQMIGRGLRPLPGDPVGPERKTFAGAMQKQDCIILDLVDVARKHSLMTAPQLYGLPPLIMAEGEDLEEMLEEFEVLKDKFPDLDEQLQGQRLTLEQLQAVATKLDIWSEKPLGAEFQAAVSLEWNRVSDEVYRITYPFESDREVVEISRDFLGHWQILCTITPEHGPKRQKSLQHGIHTLEEAGKLAEDYIRGYRRQVVRLRDPNAAWKKLEASPGQLAALRKHKVPHNPATITKGEASRLMDRLAFVKGWV